MPPRGAGGRAPPAERRGGVQALTLERAPLRGCRVGEGAAPHYCRNLQHDDSAA